jgi:hypothetical protein
VLAAYTSGQSIFAIAEPACGGGLMNDIVC